jgi:hypothetical protein
MFEVFVLKTIQFDDVGFVLYDTENREEPIVQDEYVYYVTIYRDLEDRLVCLALTDHEELRVELVLTAEDLSLCTVYSVDNLSIQDILYPILRF